MFDFKPFPGLYQALKGFEFIDKLSFIRDPGYGYEHVFLFKGEFDDGKYGLFIWDNRDGKFIEEPAELEAYNIKSIAELYKKYPGLRPQK